MTKYFMPGDVVTRDGTDEQEVLWTDEEGYALEVRCIKAPASGWCQIGDKETNLARRYELVLKNVGPLAEAIIRERKFTMLGGLEESGARLGHAIDEFKDAFSRTEFAKAVRYTVEKMEQILSRK